MDHEQHAHIIDFLFHPVLVHFPIAFYLLEVILIALWLKSHDSTKYNFARFTFWLGYGFMILAMMAGFFDAGGLKGITSIVRPHFYSALATGSIYTLRALYWYFARYNSPYYRWMLLAGALIGYSSVLVTGYFGGDIVYG